MRFVDVSAVRSRFDEPLVADDGTRLSADVYLPPDPGRYPVLLTRTPYDNNRFGGFGGGSATPAPAERFKLLAALGFAVVAADVRGRGDSDGRFVPFADDARDGATTVEWARSLPESNGRVGVFGSGYAGYAALRAATAAPVDALAVASPFAPEAMPFRGGALCLEWLFWLHLVGGRTPQPVDVPRWGEVFRRRPPTSMPETLGRDDTPWVEWLEGGPGSPSAVAGEGLETLRCPVLFVTGWWDGALGSTVGYWEEARRVRPELDHSLLVGPWDTEAVRHPRADVGGVAWGPAATLDPDQLLVDWFAARLGEETAPPASPARVFLTGRNEWAPLDSLEPEPGRTTLWLGSAGRANTRRGDGFLAASAPVPGPPDCFTHDPERPVPWQPDPGSFSRSGPKLTLDSSFATGRDDVLVYDGEPVASATFLLGRATARLWVKTTAADADWIAAVEDVFPGGGRSVHLAHGIVRAGSTAGVPLPPGPLEIEVELPPVAHELLPGHFLRLVVCSSLFPLYAVNLGALDYLRGTEANRSEHTLFHDERRPSALEIPIRKAPS